MTGPGERPEDGDLSQATAGHRDCGVETRLLYRVEEAAEILALSKSTVFELLASGELRRVKIGRALRIAASELERFVEQLESSGGVELRP